MRRRLVTAVVVPIGAFLVFAAVLYFIFDSGTRSHDPLTLNSQARDAVVALAPPTGWSRTPVEVLCTGGDARCAGGAFLEVGTSQTSWLAPASRSSRVAAAARACDQLSAELATMTRVDLGDCRKRTLAVTPAAAADAIAVATWSDSHGTWTVTPVSGTGRLAYRVRLVPA